MCDNLFCESATENPNDEENVRSEQPEQFEIGPVKFQIKHVHHNRNSAESIAPISESFHLARDEQKNVQCH